MHPGHPALTLAVFGLLAAPAAAQDDRELQVNTHVDGTQTKPRVESLVDDRFLVVWQDGDAPISDTDDDGTRVTGRFLDASGVPTGDAFQVNTTILGDQLAPRVARTTDGSLVVVWTGEQLAFRRFSPMGVAIGDDVAIPAIQTVGGVDIAPGTDGSFLVVWDCMPDCLGGSGYDIVAQLFDSDGNAASVAERVSVETSRHHLEPHVASLGAPRVLPPVPPSTDSTPRVSSPRCGTSWRAPAATRAFRRAPRTARPVSSSGKASPPTATTPVAASRRGRASISSSPATSNRAIPCAGPAELAWHAENS